jgi:hypothetical protein
MQIFFLVVQFSFSDTKGDRGTCPNFENKEEKSGTNKKEKLALHCCVLGLKSLLRH